MVRSEMIMSMGWFTLPLCGISEEGIDDWGIAKGPG